MSFLKSGDLSIISKLKLNPFENVIAVATIRPESLYRAIVAFVDQVLGKTTPFLYLITHIIYLSSLH